jgi:lysophospholipase L1-like esterase
MKRDWDIVTSYIDNVGTSDKTVLFPKPQDSVKVTNKGNTNLIYTIGTKSGTLAPNGSVTVNEVLTNFSLRAETDRAEYEVKASEAGTDQEESTPTLPSDVAGTIEELQSSVAQKAAQTYVDSQDNLKRDKSAPITLSDLHTEVKTAMTGGSVAVVGVNAVGVENLNYEQTKKDNILKKITTINATLENLFNKWNVETGFYYEWNTGTKKALASYSATSLISVVEGQQYRINLNGQQITFWNSQGVYVSGIQSSTSSAFTIPAGVSYLRVGVPNVNLDTFMVVKGTVMPGAYIGFAENDGQFFIPKNKFKVEEVDELKAQIQSSSLTETVTAIGKNKFDKTKITSGYFVNKDTGVLAANASWFVSDYIPITLGKTYSFSPQTGAQYACYDTNKVYLSGGQTSNGMTPNQSAVYMRVSGLLTNLDTYQVEEGSVVTVFEAFSSVTTTRMKDNYVPTLVYNRLNDNSAKVLDTLGDSLTFMELWQATVQKRLGLASYSNHGIGGAVVTTINGRDCFNAMRTNVNLNANIITVWGGTNDWASMATIGNVDDTVDTTFCGAINSLIQYFTTNAPKATLVFITPIQRFSNMSAYSFTQNADGEWINTSGKRLEEYVNAMISVCQRRGIPCLDFYHNSGINKFNHATFLSDALHPNSTGGKWLGNKIAGFIDLQI